MTGSFTDPDEWYQEYNQATQEGKYELVMQTITQPLTEEFIENSDLITPLLDLKNWLADLNRNAELVSFIEKFRDSQPELYRREYSYFDEILVKYYLYLNQPDKVREALARFEEMPDVNIDKTLLYYLSLFVMYR